MKKIIVLIGFIGFVLSAQAQFRRTVTDEGSYFKVANGLTDTILVEKSKVLYVRQEGSQASLVMFGYGGQNVSIKVDSSGWSSGSIQQFAADLIKSVSGIGQYEVNWFDNLPAAADTITYAAGTYMSWGIAGLPSNTDTLKYRGSSAGDWSYIVGSETMSFNTGLQKAPVGEMQVITKTTAGARVFGILKEPN